MEVAIRLSPVSETDLGTDRGGSALNLASRPRE